MLFFDDFLNFADDNGVGVAFPDKIKGTGEIERFTVKGDKKGSLNGWLIWRDELKPSCTFGSWKTGQQVTWFAESEENISDKERKERKRKIAEARAKAKRARREEQERERIQASQQAAKMWGEASDDTKKLENHGYVKSKQIKPYFSKLDEETGALIVPMLNHRGELASAQRIYPNGKKLFLPGGQVSGTLLCINGDHDDMIFICEGYSTGCTVREITGCTTLISWNAGNLQFLAQYAAAKYPKSQIFICADNDHQTYINGVKTNIGELKAIEAAKLAGSQADVGVLFYGTEQHGTDWNDYACIRGLEEAMAWFDFRLKAAINGEPEYV